MDFNQIDVLEQFGNVWQGGSVDIAIDQPPFEAPLLIVCMDAGEANEQWIDHRTVEAVLAVWINDDSQSCLKDEVILNLARMLVEWLKGGHVYLHCAAGISRASYIDIAVHCTALKISANEALSLIRQHRPVANPNPGFLSQLTRLFPEETS